MPSLSRKLFCLFVAAALAGGVPAVVTTAGAQAPPIETNLIVNGDFPSNLSGWMEEYNDNLGSDWSDWDANDSSNSGSFWGKARGGTDFNNVHFTYGTVGWRCVDVVPGRMYYFAGDFKGFTTDSSTSGKSGFLYLQDITGEPCPTSNHIDEYLPPGTFLDLQYNVPPGSETSNPWESRSETFLVPSGVNKVRVGLHVIKGFYGNFIGDGYDTTVRFDNIVLGKLRPDMSVGMSVSDTVLEVGEEFDIHLGLNSQYNGFDAELRVFHDDRLELVDWDCSAGSVVSVQQGGDHYFQWFNISGATHPYALPCTITARAKPGFDDVYSMFAQGWCNDCGDDINPGNDITSVDIEFAAAPDIGVQQVSWSEFPQPGEDVELEVSFHNHGTKFTATSVTVTIPPELLFQPAGEGQCANFSATGGGTVTGTVALSAGQTVDCTFTWEVLEAQSAAELSATVTTVTTGDYNPVNDSGGDSTRIVNLLVNRSIDGLDGSPGDGICESSSGNDACSLRAAVMEANALQAATGRAFTVKVPYTPFSYTLTRTTGDDAALYGSLQINRRMSLVGLPGENGELPLVLASFPSADADRLIRIGNPAGFVLIENMCLRGQNLVPTDTDGLGTDGGLILHQSGALELRNVTLADGATDGDGGAIYSVSDDANGDLKLDRVRVFDNTADGYGGGIAFVPESVALFSASASELHDNVAGIGGGGLVIFAEEPGSLPLPAIDSSTIYANEALVGGGVYASEVLSVSIRNSTISGNTAVQPGGVGGGVAARSSTGLQIHNSTIAFNQAAPGDPDMGRGGGIDLDSGATATLYNSIVSGNTARLECSQPDPPLPPICVPRAADCYGTLDSAGYNAMNSALDTECHLNDTTGDYDGGVALAPLADNGGPTPTHAPDSIAQIVDAGDPACMTSPGGDPLTVDQRGALRPADGDDSGIAQCDRGAYELSESARITVVVDDDSLGRVNSSPGGIACGADTGNQCSALFAFETEVELTATVASGSGGEFVGWEGACAGQGNPCMMIAAGEQEATALFAPVSATRTLTVELLGEIAGGTVTSAPAGIDCPDGTCEADFDTGATVQLSAAANPGFEFVGFVGEGCAGTGPCTVTMDFNRQVWAEFARATGHVDVSLAGTGSGHVSSDPIGISCPNDCDHDWPANETVTLTAQPASDSDFAGWSGACAGTGDCVLDISQAPHDVNAIFDEGDPSPGGDTIFSDRFEQ